MSNRLNNSLNKHVEPLSFEEFLLANTQMPLHDYVRHYHFTQEIPAAIHEKLTTLFKEYLVIGGLPAVVSSWINEHSLHRVNQIQHDLITTYRDDFSKYKERLNIDRLDKTLLAVPKMLGQKFIFSKVNKSIQAATINHILNLFEKARITHRTDCTSANGIPLAAEIKDKCFKEIFRDVGLCSTLLGLNLYQIQSVDDIILINNSGIAEQVVGQLLRTIEPFYKEPASYYWQREEPGSNAEIDYILQHKNQVIPIEVKAGTSGSLKSLHTFMGQKKTIPGYRINSDYPSQMLLDLKDSVGNPVKYQLMSIPFYLIGQIHRLLAAN